MFQPELDLSIVADRALHDDSRYQHVVIPTCKGNQFIHVDNYYAPQGQPDIVQRDCSRIVERILERGNVPCIFSTDLNRQAQDVPALQQAISL
eukprot:7245386-Karenia_brevis.AAC.1